jgi:molecular chaperone HscB
MIIRIVLARGYLFKSRSFSSKTDYFQILGIDRSFDIHPDRLKDIYKDNMKILHPDLNTMKSDTEKITIANQASQVTAAYQVLSDPHERAMHLLELLKTPMEEQATVRYV